LFKMKRSGRENSRGVAGEAQRFKTERSAWHFVTPNRNESPGVSCVVILITSIWVLAASFDVVSRPSTVSTTRKHRGCC
jgi:hypothetical protein